jgi:hypothetical protein
MTCACRGCSLHSGTRQEVNAPYASYLKGQSCFSSRGKLISHRETNQKTDTEKSHAGALADLLPQFD